MREKKKNEWIPSFVATVDWFTPFGLTLTAIGKLNKLAGSYKLASLPS